jgi:myo-inositol-1(or 4)-monophosphatase
LETTAVQNVGQLLETAELAARRAGALLKARFEQTRTVEFKSGIDLVTDADKDSERELIDFIRTRHPSHAFLAEESGAHRGAEVTWVIDPLDGTTNYSHRVPHFCVSIAGEAKGGLVLVGVVYDPMREETFAAARGGGATLNGQRIRPSHTRSLAEALLTTGFPYDVRERPEAPVGMFNHLIRQVQGVRRFGSAALDLSYVASGRFDGFFEFGLRPWDIAAGALILEEAGGKVTRIDGQPLDLAIGDIVAANSSLHAPLAEQCAAFLKQIQWRPNAK